MKMKKEIVETEREISLITTNGREIKVKYKINEDVDDYILESLRKGVRNNEIN